MSLGTKEIRLAEFGRNGAPKVVVVEYLKEIHSGRLFYLEEGTGTPQPDPTTAGMEDKVLAELGVIDPKLSVNRYNTRPDTLTPIDEL